MVNTHMFFESIRNSSDSSRKQIFRDFFLFYHEIVCYVYSLESPHPGDSNEYTQHTIIVQKIEKSSQNYRCLLPDLAQWLTLSSSNYPYLEQILWARRCSSHWCLPVGFKFSSYERKYFRTLLYMWVSKPGQSHKLNAYSKQKKNQEVKPLIYGLSSIRLTLHHWTC